MYRYVHGEFVAPHVGAWIETIRKSGGYMASVESRPTWARGLKQECRVWRSTSSQSRPTWARGLKLVCVRKRALPRLSRPTWARGLKLGIIVWLLSGCVAPHVGAWIETRGVAAVLLEAMSRPTWARGLKHVHLFQSKSRAKSRPTWARGLKPIVTHVTTTQARTSRPTWARGLKLCSQGGQQCILRCRAPRGRVD